MGHRVHALCLLIASFGMGCSHRAPLPVSHAQSGEETVGRGMEPLADDPARVEVRRLHVICDETVHALRDGVEDANRRETLLTAVAGLAYILAGAGGSPNSSMRHRGEGGPVDERTDEVHLSASAQVRKINEAVDRLDEMIFSKPPSEAWNFDEEARFWELTEALSAACERQPVH